MAGGLVRTAIEGVKATGFNVGDVINVGNTSSGKDFEGNVDGKVYMNESVADTAYFSWAEWDEGVDGPAPFLKLERE